MQEVLFLMPWGVIKKGWDKLISRNHMLIPLLKIIGTGRVVARQLGQKNIWKPQRIPNLMRPNVSPPLRRLVGMSLKAWKVQRVSAAAGGLITLPPDSILNSIFACSAVMSQEHDSILKSTLSCSAVMSQENDSVTELRAQIQEQSLDGPVERVCIEQNCGNHLPSSDPPEVCEP